MEKLLLELIQFVRRFVEKKLMVEFIMSTTTISECMFSAETCPLAGVQTIAPEENYPQVEVKVSVKVRVRVGVGGNFPREQLS